MTTLCKAWLNRRSQDVSDIDGSGPVDDVARARKLAFRYRCEFADLSNFKLTSEILARVPAALMLRYNFLPVEEMKDGRLAIAIADPTQLMLIDEISLLLGKRLIVRVTTFAQIKHLLQGIDSSPNETAVNPYDEPWNPAPDAPVTAPKRPRPHLRSGTATAIPEEEQ